MTFSSRFSLTYRDIVVGVLVMLLAFALRVVVTVDRAHNNSGFAPLPEGTDQKAYVDQAQLYEAGKWPTEPFYWQPGFIYFLVGISALVGRTIGQLTLGIALVSALSCGFMVAVGWLVTRRRWGGYLAGLLLAIYPVAIFYSTTLLTESLSSVYVTLFLFLALWQYETRTIWRSALLGLICGLLTITRTNLGVLVLAWLMLLWLDTRRNNSLAASEKSHFKRIQALFPRLFVIHAIITVLFMALMIAPVTLWNRQSSKTGDFALVTDTGMIEMYRGNNRDSDGLRDENPAMITVGGDYLSGMIADALRDPLHFVELQLRKAGLFWSADEPGNNVDYVQDGTDASPLLRTIPLNFLEIAFLGWLGTYLLILTPHDMSSQKSGETFRTIGWFLLVVNVLIFAGVQVIWVASRSKQLAVPPLIVASAYVIVKLGEWLWNGTAQRRKGNSLHIRWRYAVLTAGLVLFFGGLIWAENNLPQLHPVGVLPADVRPLDVVFGNQLKLVGWRTLPEWPAAERSWTHFQRAYVIQLYWQLLEPTTDNYNMYLAYVDNGQRLAGIDRAIGTVSFRPKPTSEWQPGDIYGEIIGFDLPQNLPRERDADIRLGVYRAEGEAGDPNRTVTPVAATSLADNPTSIVVQRLAVFDTGYIGTELQGFTTSPAVFGDQIALRGYKLTEQAAPGETITLSLYWKALQEVTQDYTMFIHVEDEAGKVVVQSNSPPRQNTLVTSTWPPDYPIQDDIQLHMPPTPGLYHVYVGLYDSQAPNHDRLFASTSDGRWLLGTVMVGG